MAEIIGMNGAKLGSGTGAPTPAVAKERQAHQYTVTTKSGNTVSIYGKLFITPLFVAFENDDGEFDYILSFEEFSSLFNSDTSEAASS